MDNIKHPNAPARLPKMSTPRYEPKIGDTITVELPDERTRAQIEKVISQDAVIARLMTFTTSKSHQYRKDDLVACRFEMLGMTIPGWRAMSQRELDEADSHAKKTRKKRA
jgi:hypothetical protein